MGLSPADGPRLPEHRGRRVVPIGQRAAAGGDSELARGRGRGLAQYKLRGLGWRIAEEGLGGHRRPMAQGSQTPMPADGSRLTKGLWLADSSKLARGAGRQEAQDSLRGVGWRVAQDSLWALAAKGRDRPHAGANGSLVTSQRAPTGEQSKIG
jgi:hypothetical protein